MRVIESKAWRHVSGRTVSPYGACPWLNDNDRAEWSLITRGWTIALDNGRVGIGRLPFETREEAQEWIDAHQRAAR